MLSAECGVKAKISATIQHSAKKNAVRRQGFQKFCFESGENGVFVFFLTKVRGIAIF